MFEQLELKNYVDEQSEGKWNYFCFYFSIFRGENAKKMENMSLYPPVRALLVRRLCWSVLHQAKFRPKPGIHGIFFLMIVHLSDLSDDPWIEKYRIWQAKSPMMVAVVENLILSPNREFRGKFC